METPSNLLAHFTLGTYQGLRTGLVLGQWFSHCGPWYWRRVKADERV